MKLKQKLLALFLMSAMLIAPSFTYAASSISTCTSIATAGQKTYRSTVKVADKDFAQAVKLAEKEYKDSIKAGQDKATAFHELRESTWASFKIRKQTVESADAIFDDAMQDEYELCLKDLSPAPSKSAYAKVCSKLILSYIKDALSESANQVKLLKKTHATKDEEKQYKTDKKWMDDIWKSIRSDIKEVCDDSYTEYFGGSDDSDEDTNSGDAKRISDVRQMASALELYWDDNSRYPTSISELSPNYIATIPTAPKSTSSKCSASKNTYTYTYISESAYTLTFCLGTSIIGLSAGTHTLSQAGIN